MIAYFILIRLKSYFKGLRNLVNIGTTILLILIAWFYGWMLASLINKASNGEIGKIEPDVIINYALCAIMGFVLLRMILPRYKPQRQYLPNFYPVSDFQHYLISVISDFMKPLFFSVTLFVITCCVCLHDSKFSFLLLGLGALISAQLFRRLIQYGIDFRLKIAGYILLAISFLILVLLSSFYNFFSHYLKALSLFIPAFLFIIGYFIEVSTIENRQNQISGGTRKSNFYLKLIINNPKVRLMLLVGILLKLIILIMDFFIFRNKGKHIFDGQVVYWMFASPLIFFTYIFNNTWGYWKSIWLNYELRSGEYKEMLLFASKLLIIPLLIDLVITIPLLLLLWDNTLFIVIFYVVSSIFLISFACLWSILFPINIKATFQMRGSSSFVSSLVSMVAVILLSVLKINYWFYALIPFYLVASIVACKYSLDLYRTKKYILINKLLKE